MRAHLKIAKLNSNFMTEHFLFVLDLWIIFRKILKIFDSQLGPFILRAPLLSASHETASKTLCLEIGTAQICL